MVNKVLTHASFGCSGIEPVRYAQIDLGIIDPRTNRLIRFVPPRSDRKKAKQPKRLLPMYPV